MLTLIINYKEVMLDFLPLHLRAASHRLIVAVWPKSKAYKVFFNEVGRRTLLARQSWKFSTFTVLLFQGATTVEGGRRAAALESH